VTLLFSAIHCQRVITSRYCIVWGQDQLQPHVGRQWLQPISAAHW